jgi:hypothetical protein
MVAVMLFATLGLAALLLLSGIVRTLGGLEGELAEGLGRLQDAQRDLSEP